jgi:hypothetical protein
MPTRWLALPFLLALLGTAAAEDGAFRWRTDLEAARREAARSGKPLLIVFRCVP